jgi:hypothetical protein
MGVMRSPIRGILAGGCALATLWGLAEWRTSAGLRAIAVAAVDCASPVHCHFAAGPHTCRPPKAAAGKHLLVIRSLRDWISGNTYAPDTASTACGLVRAMAGSAANFAQRLGAGASEHRFQPLAVEQMEQFQGRPAEPSL